MEHTMSPEPQLLQTLGREHNMNLELSEADFTFILFKNK